MIIDEWTSDDVRTQGGGESPPCAGLASNALPKAQSITSAESSQTGVSTRNARSEIMFQPQKQGEIPHWYVLRCTYGREKKAYNYMVSQGITAFYPTIEVVKLINGKRKKVTESRLPNIFFAFGTEHQIKAFVYDNAKLLAKTEHPHPLGMVVSTHFRCGKGVKRGLKNGALPFNID